MGSATQDRRQFGIPTGSWKFEADPRKRWAKPRKCVWILGFCDRHYDKGRQARGCKDPPQANIYKDLQGKSPDAACTEQQLTSILRSSPMALIVHSQVRHQVLSMLRSPQLASAAPQPSHCYGSICIWVFHHGSDDVAAIP